MNIVLSSLGARIIVKEGQFLVKTAETEQLLPAQRVTTITMGKGGSISGEAVMLAIANQIDVVFTDHLGNHHGRIWSIEYGSISTIRKGQVEFLYSSKAVEWVKKLVQTKINNQIAMLLLLSQESSEERIIRKIQTIVNGMTDHQSKIMAAEGDMLPDMAPSIRGWEGAAARRYFEGLNLFLPAEIQFEKRTTNPATDKFNSALNYGYGILYGKVEGALIKAGIDPYTGIFHRDEYNRPALVFDVIEKYRVWIDYVVVRLAAQGAFSDDCFISDDTGALMLQGLGKRLLIQSVNDYLSETVARGSFQRSRQQHIQQDAHDLAKIFLNAAKG